MGFLYVTVSLSVTLLCHYYITLKSRSYYSSPNFSLETYRVGISRNIPKAVKISLSICYLIDNGCI